MTNPRKSIKFAFFKGASPFGTPKKQSLSFTKQDKKDSTNQDLVEEEKNFDYNLFQFDDAAIEQVNLKKSG